MARAGAESGQGGVFGGKVDLVPVPSGKTPPRAVSGQMGQGPLSGPLKEVGAMRVGQDCPSCEGVLEDLRRLRAEVAKLQEAVAEAAQVQWAAYREFAELRPTVEWAKEFFPEFSFRLGAVEQALVGAEPPQKPWLPPKVEPLKDQALQAHRFREAMTEDARKRLDLEEGQWPYCAWHFVHARMRGHGEVVTTALDPRDKLALDAAQRMAEEVAHGCELRGGDLFFYWVQRFLSHDVESWDGATLADKFYRAAKTYPKRLPTTLCEDWPNDPHEAFAKTHEPLWPREEIGFQWAMLRDHAYVERAKKVAELEEEHRRRSAEANAAREQRERELREEYMREQAEFDADLKREHAEWLSDSARGRRSEAGAPRIEVAAGASVDNVDLDKEVLG